jgi:hypothetical protein
MVRIAVDHEVTQAPLSSISLYGESLMIYATRRLNDSTATMRLEFWDLDWKIPICCGTEGRKITSEARRRPEARRLEDRRLDLDPVPRLGGGLVRAARPAGAGSPGRHRRSTRWLAVAGCPSLAIYTVLLLSFESAKMTVSPMAAAGAGSLRWLASTGCHPTGAVGGADAVRPRVRGRDQAGPRRGRTQPRAVESLRRRSVYFTSDSPYRVIRVQRRPNDPTARGEAWRTTRSS